MPPSSNPTRISRREIARTMAEDGITVAAICESLGIAPRTYFAWRAAGNWPSRAIQPLPGNLRTEAMTMLDGGESISEISRQLGVSRKTISRWRRSRPIQKWRCPCTPFGVLVLTDRCGRCNSPALWVSKDETA